MKRRTPSDSSSRTEPSFVRVEIPGESTGAGLRLQVARFPTTVAEYHTFIEAGGYENEGWWSKRGWLWRKEHSITFPKYWGKPRYSIPSLPVTGISFWEAEAYARFREAALPTEWEWYLLSSNGGGSRFPWGDDGAEPSKERANLSFFGQFGKSSRVPVEESTRSGSTAGVRDLIGNVAEWCIPGSNLELPPGEMTGVLRGGAAWHVPDVADSSFRDVVPLTVRDNQTGIRLIRRDHFRQQGDDRSVIGWPSPPRMLGRSIKRPTSPFRQEGISDELTDDSWRLRVYGHSVQPREFSLWELKRDFPVLNQRGLFVCVCRWGEPNTFTGVLLRDVLEACGVTLVHWHDLYLRQVSIKGRAGSTYETTVPIREAIEHDALLAWAMDGNDLTRELGWPLRFVDLHRYGYKCVKSLAELVITDELRRGWWEEACQYDIDGTILPGTITVVGEEAMRFDIQRRGRIPWTEISRERPAK